jgi:hypothetical protein
MEFGPGIKSFSENLSALREFVRQVGPMLQERKENAVKDHLEDLAPFALIFSTLFPDSEIPQGTDDEHLRGLSDKVKIVRKEGEQKWQLVFEDDQFGDRFLRAMKTFHSRTVQESLLYSSSLISLISAAEWFLSRLIQGFFEKFPDTAKTHEKAFSLDDLKGFSSIEDARRHLIEMRVDEIMRGSLEDWIKFLNTKMGLSMGYLSPHQDELIEIFQRRNLVVHNNGIVHSGYLAKVAHDLRKGIVTGHKLEVAPGYLMQAIDIVELIFILTAAELWKKLDPVDAGRGGTLIEEAFSSLVGERWKVAEGISYFLMRDKGLPERDQLVGQLNYWQSLKWQDQFDKVKLEVEKADFSAKDELFKLARLALLSDKESFFELLPSVIDCRKLSCLQFRDWPIFREMRKYDEYQKFYQEHRKDFEPPPDQGASGRRGQPADAS